MIYPVDQLEKKYQLMDLYQFAGLGMSTSDFHWAEKWKKKKLSWLRKFFRKLKIPWRLLNPLISLDHFTPLRIPRFPFVCFKTAEKLFSRGRFSMSWAGSRKKALCEIKIKNQASTFNLKVSRFQKSSSLPVRSLPAHIPALTQPVWNLHFHVSEEKVKL